MALLSPSESLAKGSENILITGMGKTAIFKGFTEYLKPDNTPYLGGEVSFNVGDDFAALTSRQDEAALGSVFRVLGALFYIGAGKLIFNGEQTNSEALSTLQVQLFKNGQLQPEVYQAGLPQPSAPVIAAIDPPVGFSGKNTGSVSVQISSVRSATGARSLASSTSNVVTCRNQAVRVTFPEANLLNGQDYWEVAVTLNGFGGVGAHYFLAEIPESSLTEIDDGNSIETTARLTSTALGTMDLPNGTLTSENLGWIAQAYQQISLTLQGADTLSFAGILRARLYKVPTTVGVTGNQLEYIEFQLRVDQNPTLEAMATAIKNQLNLALQENKIVTYVASVEGRTVTVRRTTYRPNDNDFRLEVTDLDESAPTRITPGVSTLNHYGFNSYVTSVQGNNSGTTAASQSIAVSEAHNLTVSQPIKFTKAITGIKRSTVIEWYDADLVGSDFAALNEYPPPSGLFGGVLGDVTFVDGAYGDTVNVIDRTANVTTAIRGNAIAISDPAKPESYPPDNYIFTNDAPSALIEGGQGLYWRFGRNSLGVIRYIGGQPALSYETLWRGIGIHDQNNVTLGAGGRLYAYTAGSGAVRLGQQGEPDTMFAAPVADDMMPWDPKKVCMGYDPSYGYVMFAHKNTILCFYEALEIWCAPIVLSENEFDDMEVKSFVTVDNAIFIAIGNAEITKIYGFDNGNGSVGRFVTQWNVSSGEFDIISRIKLGLRTDGPTVVSVSTYVNGQEAPTREQMVDVPSAGVHVPSTLKPNVRQARTWKISTEIESAGGDAGLEMIIVDGSSSGITV
jgi:hypothetical protein